MGSATYIYMVYTHTQLMSKYMYGIHTCTGIHRKPCNEGNALQIYMYQGYMYIQTTGTCSALMSTGRPVDQPAIQSLYAVNNWSMS